MSENTVQDAEIVEQKDEATHEQYKGQSLDPSLALFNCMIAARQAKLSADEHEIVGASFERLSRLIPGGYKQPSMAAPKKE